MASFVRRRGNTITAEMDLSAVARAVAAKMETYLAYMATLERRDKSHHCPSKAVPRAMSVVVPKRAPKRDPKMEKGVAYIATLEHGYLSTGESFKGYGAIFDYGKMCEGLKGYFIGVELKHDFPISLFNKPINITHENGCKWWGKAIAYHKSAKQLIIQLNNRGHI